MKIRKAVIPAAGLGTRFLPATKAQPKEMLPIVDKPALQYIVEEALESGIEEILIIIGRNKSSIENHFDKSVELELALKEKGQDELLEEVRKISDMADIHYIRQKEPRGLGHAIYCAKTFIGQEPFAVLLGDDIVEGGEQPGLRELMDSFETYQDPIIGVQEIDPEDVDKYGIVQGPKIKDNFYSITGLVEKPAVGTVDSNIAIIGRYIITPDIFDKLENLGEDGSGEIQLTHGLELLLEDRKLYAQKVTGKRHDVGDKLGFLKATVDFALKKEELREEFLQFLKERVEQQGSK